MTPQMRYERIGPVQAAAYLRDNRDNRPLSVLRLRRFMRALQGDGWRTEAGAIELAPDGRLLNGQHRLFAIVATQRTVLVAVQRHTETEAAA